MRNGKVVWGDQKRQIVQFLGLIYIHNNHEEKIEWQGRTLRFSIRLCVWGIAIDNCTIYPKSKPCNCGKGRKCYVRLTAQRLL